MNYLCQPKFNSKEVEDGCSWVPFLSVNKIIIFYMISLWKSAAM